jgi:hypothetical protein
MKSLASAMDDVTLRLRCECVRERNIRSAVDPLKTESGMDDKMILCKAVEDRICKKIDLASRDDLTLQQAFDALQLLLRIVRENGLSVQLSFAEKLLLSCRN